MNRLLPLSLAVSVLSSACVAHVTLPQLPSPSAPLEERKKALTELQPVFGPQNPAPFAPAYGAPQQLGFLILNDGLRIEDPMDLAPILDPVSPTVRYAQAASDESSKAQGWLGGSMAAMVVGLGCEVVGLMQLTTSPTGGGDAGTALLIGSGGLLVASLVSLAVGLVYGMQSSADRLSAFVTYPRDLRKRLALDDDASAPPSPAGPPPPTLVPAP
jgi:hypothetical protein